MLNNIRYHTDELESQSLGNIKREYASIAEQAAKESRLDVRVVDDARDSLGRPMPNLVHLVSYTPGNMHNFWIKYRELGGR